MKYPKIIIIMSFFVMVLEDYPLDATIHPGHHPYTREQYIDCPSRTVLYMNRGRGYKNYQPPKNITKNGCKWGAWITFPQKIEAIQSHVGRMQHPSDLLRSKDFLIMYKHPHYYTQAILDYLVDKKYTLAQKKIAIYASSIGSVRVLCEPAYQLYQANKIDLELLHLILAIRLSNFIDKNHVGIPYQNVLKALKKLDSEEFDLLKKIQSTIPKSTMLYKNIDEIFSNQFLLAWHKYIILINHCYYDKPLLFLDIIRYAERERKRSETLRFGGEYEGIAISPYFLMVMEHPYIYYFSYFNSSKSVKNGTRVLRDPKFSGHEKAMAVFGASQLCVAGSNESAEYASLIESACEWYRKDQLSERHLYQLFKCELPSFYETPFTTFYKYPFFILDYKKESVQDALAKFIAEPTIPEGLKAMARKVKNGTLATKEEMDYMEGYRAFRKTHFTLYETIPPRG